MAPPSVDDGSVALGGERALPSSFDLNSFSSGLSFHQHFGVQSYPTVNTDAMMMEDAKPSLTASLQIISERGDRLLGQLDGKLNSGSLIVEACSSSLRSELSVMLEEAQVLLDNMGTGGDCSVTAITPWRASLAQVRVDAYLEAIEMALKYPDRNKLDDELRSVSSTISMQLQSQKEEKIADEAQLRISPWNMSSLAFDLTVGKPLRHSLTAEDGGLPLNLEIRAIQEIQAKDIFEGGNSRSCRAYKIHVERCVHETGSFRAGAGTVGDALVVVRVSPIGAENAPPKVESTNRWAKDVESQHVKEARTVQVNAFPPSPKASVDLYVSSNHGESDTTITLRFPTYKTLNKATPEVRIELVMG